MLRAVERGMLRRDPKKVYRNVCIDEKSTVLIIFRVANVVDGSLFACWQQDVVYPEVVHNLSVALVGQPLGQKVAVGSYQFVDDGLEQIAGVIFLYLLPISEQASEPPL